MVISDLIMNSTVDKRQIGVDFERFVGVVLILTALYFLFFGVIQWEKFSNRDLYFVNFFATVTYLTIIYSCIRGRSFSVKKLALLVLAFSITFVSLYNWLFFMDHGNFLAFQGSIRIF